MPLQYIDGRDLAEWMLDAGRRGLSGAFNTVSQPGHTTMGELLEAARTTTAPQREPPELVWAPPSVIERSGIAAWTEVPIWVPPEGEEFGLHTGDVSSVYAHGMRCRPVTETVADTWAWLQSEGDPPSLSSGSVGLAPEREQAVLDAL